MVLMIQLTGFGWVLDGFLTLNQLFKLMVNLLNLMVQLMARKYSDDCHH